MKRAVQAANETRIRYGLSFPTRIGALEQICDQLGVRIAFRSTSSSDDGLLQRSGSGYTIWINPAANERRKLFTLAHEFGHLLCRRNNVRFHPAEERWCNQFAASLLMPEDEVHLAIRGTENPLDSAVKLAEASCTSLSASLIRINEVNGTEFALAHFERIGGDWVLLDTAGLPVAIAESLGTSPATTSILEPLDLGSHRLDIPIARSQVSGRVKVDLIREPGFAVAVATLSAWRHPLVG